MTSHLFGLPQLLGEGLAQANQSLLGGQGGKGEDCIRGGAGGEPHRRSADHQPNTHTNFLTAIHSPLAEPSTSASLTLAVDRDGEMQGGKDEKRAEGKREGLVIWICIRKRRCVDKDLCD